MSKWIGKVGHPFKSKRNTKDNGDCNEFLNGHSSSVHEGNESSRKMEVGEKKEHWDRQIEFFLSMMGVCVGLGNIWRFPYICHRNGGGVFLIPYFTAMALVGIPLYYLELILGQFSGLQITKLYSFCPLIKGVGWSMVLLTLVMSVQYSHCINLVVYYLGVSFSAELPWVGCNNTWNTVNCSGRLEQVTSNFTNSTNVTEVLDLNTTKHLMTPAEEFWQYKTLEITDRIEDIGGFKWQLVVCHCAVWLTVFCCLIRGIKSTGKVVYFTATAPYVFLTILLVRGCMLPGAREGILYYIMPRDWSKLLDLKVWSEAFLQIFYSVGMGNGNIQTFASYNKFRNNCKRDAILITIINCLTSFYGGFAIFSVMGYLATSSGVPVEKVITSGPGLAFIAYPEALGLLPLPQLWSVLFFLTLATLGFGSQFGHVITCMAGVKAAFPDTFKGRKRNLLLLLATCILGFLLGLIFCTRGGMYYFQIIDWYGSAFSMVFNAVIETLAVSWLYGLSRLFKDVEIMLGRKPNIVFKGFWGVVSPVLMLIFFLYSLAGFVKPSYGDYFYPPWAIALAWLIAAATMIQIPIFAIIGIVRAEGSILQRLRSLTQPSDAWKPQDPLAQLTVNYSNGNADPKQKKLLIENTVV